MIKESIFTTVNDLTTFFDITPHAIYKTMREENIPFEKYRNRRKIAPLNVRKIFEDRGFAYKKKAFAFQIVKGGVGKTSFSMNVAIRAHEYGFRVLMVDLDKQGNLSSGLGIDATELPVLFHVLRDHIPVKDAIVPLFEGFHIIPSSMNNTMLDNFLGSSSYVNKESFLDGLLQPIRNNYDLIIIDCPPDINHITTITSLYADQIIIPLIACPHTMQGLEQTMTELINIKKNFNKTFQISVVWNKYDAREKLAMKYMLELSDKEFIDKDMVIPVLVRTDTAIKKAVDEGKTIFNFPNSQAAIDLDQLTRELVGLNEFKTTYVKGGKA